MKLVYDTNDGTRGLILTATEAIIIRKAGITFAGVAAHPDKVLSSVLGPDYPVSRMSSGEHGGGDLVDGRNPRRVTKNLLSCTVADLTPVGSVAVTDLRFVKVAREWADDLVRLVPGGPLVRLGDTAFAA